MGPSVLPHRCPMAKTLTDSVVASLKPQRGQSGWRELADGATRGLCIRISPRGEKVWAIRHVVGGKRSRHTIGAYPTVSLADARKRASEYLSGTRDGMSPEEVDARAQALTITVKQAHAAYLEAVAVSTRALKDTMFRTHIEPAIGTRMIRTIRRADVVEVVSQVARKGFPVQANRVFSELMALLRGCEQKSYLDGVPSIRKKDLRNFGAAKEQPRRRALSDTEIAEVWQASANLGATSRDFLRLLLLTGQRRDEVRLMTWAEIDMEAALWVIPATRYKTGIEHAVPLPSAAMDILRTRWHDGATGTVLPGRREDQPFNGALSAIRRLRKAMANRQPFTLHDFRRTVRTGLSRLKVDAVTSELVIGHVPQGMHKVYDVYERLEERRKALEKWGRKCLNGCVPAER